MNPNQNSPAEQPTAPQPGTPQPEQPHYNYQAQQQPPQQPQMPQLQPEQPGQPVAPVNPAAADDQGPINKVGGWLLVMAIALGIGVILNAHGIMQAEETLNDSTIKAAYSLFPGLHGALNFELAVFVLSVLAGIVGIVLIIMRKRLAKPFLIAFLAGVVLAALADKIMVMNIFKDNQAALDAVKDDNAVIRAFIGAAVWIPYLRFSKRVKRTLTK